METVETNIVSQVSESDRQHADLIVAVAGRLFFTQGPQ
jgi:hypothetical protein